MNLLISREVTRLKSVLRSGDELDMYNYSEVESGFVRIREEVILKGSPYLYEILISLGGRFSSEGWLRVDCNYLENVMDSMKIKCIKDPANYNYLYIYSSELYRKGFKERAIQLLTRIYFSEYKVSALAEKKLSAIKDFEINDNRE